MGLHRVSIVAWLSALLVVAGAVGALAQDSGSEEQLCISVSGAPPANGWDVLSLSVAIASGNATIASVGAAGECAAAAPTATPAEEPVVDEPVVDEPVVDEPVAAVDQPLPIEVVESAVFGKGEEAAYYALLRNPNEGDWVATWMPVRVDLLDADQGLVSTYDRSVTILPGQTVAIIGYRGEAEGATQIEVVAANGDSDWAQVAEIPGELTFSQIKTKVNDSGTKTTGRISSPLDWQLESVNVYLLYRDPSGKVVGANNTYVDFIPAGGDSNFMVESWSEKKPDIASTEAYYDGFLPPQG
jgi:hypothetical protein